MNRLDASGPSIGVTSPSTPVASEPAISTPSQPPSVWKRLIGYRTGPTPNERLARLERMIDENPQVGFKPYNTRLGNLKAEVGKPGFSKLIKSFEGDLAGSIMAGQEARKAFQGRLATFSQGIYDASGDLESGPATGHRSAHRAGAAALSDPYLRAALACNRTRVQVVTQANLPDLAAAFEKAVVQHLRANGIRVEEFKPAENPNHAEAAGECFGKAFASFMTKEADLDMLATLSEGASPSAPAKENFEARLAIAQDKAGTPDFPAAFREAARAKG